MSIYFSIMDESHQDEFPTCDYVEVDQGEYFPSLKLRPNDPRVKQAKKDDKYCHKINSGIHYFNEAGFLQCKICGWTP